MTHSSLSPMVFFHHATHVAQHDAALPTICQKIGPARAAAAIIPRQFLQVSNL